MKEFEAVAGLARKNKGPERFLYNGAPEGLERERITAYSSRFLEEISFEPLFDDILLEEVPDFKIDLPEENWSVNFRNSYEKLRERSAGPREGISVGYGWFGPHKTVVLSGNWNVRAAATGRVEGQAVVEGFLHAAEHNLPIVFDQKSGGMDQMQAAESLQQMPRMATALAIFKRNSNQPYISVLAGPTYGGTSASIALEGHLNLAVGERNRVAFTGQEIINFIAKNITHDMAGVVTPFDQSALVNMLNGNGVDGIISETSVIEVVKKLLDILSPVRHEPATTESHSRLRSLAHRVVDAAQHITNHATHHIVMHDEGVRSLTAHPHKHTARNKQHGEMYPVRPATDVSKYSGTELEAQQFELHTKVSETSHIDTMAVLQYGFDNYLLMRNPYDFNRRLHFNNFVTAYARSGLLPVVVVGQQPDYSINNGELQRHFAMPGPEDWQRATQAIRRAETLGIPVITLLDSPGAQADRKADLDGQSLAMSKTLQTISDAKVPVLTYVIGAAGSGGSICAASLFPKPTALDSASIVVATPNAAAIILNRNSSDPSLKAIAAVRDQMKPGVRNWVGESSIFRSIIPSGDSTIATARAIGKAIAKDLETYGNLTEEQLVEGRLNMLVATSKGIAVKRRNN